MVLICALGVSAQENKCSAKLADLPSTPELFGFRMGMTEPEVTARVPQARFAKPNDFGVAKTSISPDYDPKIDKASFSGVRTVSLDFLDGRVSSLWFGYDSTFKWRTVPEFVEGISKSLRLPETWSEWKTRGQQMKCADFSLTVTLVAEGPSFHIIDETAEQTIAERREAKEEADSATEGEPASGAPLSAQLIADREKKIYYAEGCLPQHEIKEGERVFFKSREDAEKAGYKLATKCQ
jgi:hypothetical protein